MKASRKPQVQCRGGPWVSHCCSVLTSFSLSCLLQIKAGPKVLGPFCGEKAPEPINTQTHNIMILFRSDNSGENRGWKLSYKATGNLVIALSPHGAEAEGQGGAGLGLL